MIPKMNIPQPAIIDICLEALRKEELEAEKRVHAIISAMRVMQSLKAEWEEKSPSVADEY